MTISEKVAYLKGLSEGLGITKEESKEAKMIVEIIKVLEEVGYSIEDLEAVTDDISEEIDAVSDDLQDLEEIVYEEDDEDYEDDDEPDFFATECPSCGAELLIDEEALEEGFVICPECESKFALDLSDEEEETEELKF